MMLSPEELDRRKEALERRKELKKLYRRRRITLFALLFFLSIGLMMLSAYFGYRHRLEVATPVSQVEPGSRRINVLFMGLDKTVLNNSRTDTMMLVSIEPESGRVGVISIPRDTRVWLPGPDRYDRVNAAYAHGGPELAMQAVSDLLEIPVNYYLKTDFQGFASIIDTLGGVEIDIEREMYYVDNAQDLHIHLLPGNQRLDGDKALQYIRFRDRLGDVALVDSALQKYDGRVERQLKFVNALSKEVLQARNLIKLPKLLAQVWGMVDTNLPWDEVLSLAIASGKFTPEQVTTAVVPGTSGIMHGASYWLPDETRLRQTVGSVAQGKPPALRAKVLNGNGEAGSASAAADVLRQHGFDVLSLGNADHFNYPQTRVVVSDPKNEVRVQGLAESLDALVVVEQEEVSGVDVTIIIGRDFMTANRSVGI